MPHPLKKIEIFTNTTCQFEKKIHIVINCKVTIKKNRNVRLPHRYLAHALLQKLIVMSGNSVSFQI